jgi:hypothetical protein
VTDQKILELLMVSAAQAIERAKGCDDVTQGRIAVEFFNGVHQSTAFLSRWDGEVSPQRLNKILSEGMKLVGLTIGSTGQDFVPKSPPAN